MACLYGYPPIGAGAGRRRRTAVGMSFYSSALRPSDPSDGRIRPSKGLLKRPFKGPLQAAPTRMPSARAIHFQGRYPYRGAVNPRTGCVCCFRWLGSDNWPRDTKLRGVVFGRCQMGLVKMGLDKIVHFEKNCQNVLELLLLLLLSWIPHASYQK